MAVAASVVAQPIRAALAHQTWSFNTSAGLSGAARAHLFLLRHGRAQLPGGAVALDVVAPALLWLPPSQRGALQILAGGDGYTASIGPELVQRIAADPALAVPLRPLLDRRALASGDKVAAALPGLLGSFEALVAEQAQQQPAAAAVIGLHLGLLMLLLWRASALHRQPAGAHGAGTTTAQRFRQLIELHYREALHVAEFAARLGVSRAHLHEACLRATGRTPLALLHARLLEEAQARLQHTDLSVEQVGYGLGFRDPGYFSRFFRRLTGQSPGAFRRSATAAALPSFAAWP